MDKNKLNNKGQVIGDKRTHGSRNIKFFWNSKRYLNENVYHAIATSCMILLLVFVIICIIIFNIYNLDPRDQSHWTNLQKMVNNVTLYAIIIPCFCFLLTSIICKLKERKIRKLRMFDLSSSEGRKIEV